MAEHGTRASYVAGCRCQDCRYAHNAYVREYRRLQARDAKAWREMQAYLERIPKQRGDQ
jgi:hypothetical protein